MALASNFQASHLRSGSPQTSGNAKTAGARYDVAFSQNQSLSAIKLIFRDAAENGKTYFNPITS